MSLDTIAREGLSFIKPITRLGDSAFGVYFIEIIGKSRACFVELVVIGSALVSSIGTTALAVSEALACTNGALHQWRNDSLIWLPPAS